MVDLSGIHLAPVKPFNSFIEISNSKSPVKLSRLLFSLRLSQSHEDAPGHRLFLILQH